jgi:hypothetical protein
MPLDTNWHFLSSCGAEVPDFAHAIESDAPTRSEFGDTLRQQLDFAVLVGCNVDVNEHDLAERRRLEIERRF